MKGLIIEHNSKLESLESLVLFFSDIEMKVVNYKEFKPEIAEGFDFIVLSGGPIHISDKNDLIIEKDFIKRTDKPILGICLGMQILAITYGAKLLQLRQKRDGLFDIELFGKKGKICHSHGWFIKDLPEEFMLLQKQENIIEAIQHKEKPILAFQGHPERSGEYGKFIRDLFLEKFVKR